MDEIEKIIVNVLLRNEELSYTQIFCEVLKHLKKDKNTVIDRLRKLEKEKILTHKDKKYFLIPQNRRKIYKNIRKEIGEYRKKVDKLSNDKDVVGTGLILLEKIFDEFYVPLQYEALCHWSNFPKSEMIKIRDDLKKCGKLITETAEKIKNVSPEIGEKLPLEDFVIFTPVRKKK
jgi:DNA-binding Lrp family transcriptional regulator